jgi:succinylglutamic semialdehyde dehydrogenase
MTTFSSFNPATGEVVWTGTAANRAEIDAAVTRARAAFRPWSQRPYREREAFLRTFARVLETRQPELAEAISLEVGKPRWESLAEVHSMITKVDFAVRGYAQRCAEFGSGRAVTRFRPHGVCAVFGPFNFPGHLPNGHIVPALLAGNTIVFKPSEYAPLVAECTRAVWHDAGLPPDVLQVIQGDRETGATLATHSGIDGLFFTGSARTGLWLAEHFARTPEKILALELGGNNPLVVWSVRDVHAAALIVAQSAFATAGQRCTCARRLIVSSGTEGDAVIDALRKLISRIRVGVYTDVPEPYMGPVISAQVANEILRAQDALCSAGATPIVRVRQLRHGTGLVTPGFIDVTTMSAKPADEELFGPLLQLIRVRDFEAAIAEANATGYGLAAGILTDERALYERFRDNVRAGIVNWNQPLTGASGAAPFGGVGRSGNHRPSGLFAADYCSYPVASIETPELNAPAQLPVGITRDSSDG